ncbi:hypothetical protein HCR18_01040, partial [Wolbachia pipientis]|uniref:hypothetical protein n=1 Tax=Wolbachia pipientis TaxID=955 RepID=UPI0015FD59DA
MLPSKNAKNSSHEQSGHSRSSGKADRKTSKKRKRSVADKDDTVSKELRVDVNVTSNEDSVFPSDLQDEPRQNLFHEERKFAKSVAGREDTPRFNKFLDFLIKGEGRRYLEILKREGVNLTNMFSILGRAGANASKAFKDLYDLWFDAEENKTQYLKTLEEEGINLAN